MVKAQKIGLEIHIYPKTAGKMFCTCSADFLNSPPNSNICPICAGQPGSKPMGPNRSCIVAGVQIARQFSMKLSGKPVGTMRKHYFYPDLPSNYQRTAEPLATGGKIGEVALREIHWEEDPGQYDLTGGEVDLNRSGVPLLELVTEPAIRNGGEARSLLNDLLLLLQYLGISRDEAPFKVDTNISVDGGRRVEVKNINSVSGVLKALEFEYIRQCDLIDSGIEVEQETRGFDDIGGRTVPMRFKETSEDYRYMLDPDINPVDLGSIHVPSIANLFELLSSMKSEGIREADGRTILADSGLLRAYNMIAGKVPPAFASVFVSRDIKSELNFRKLPSSFLNAPGRLEQLASIATDHSAGRLSNQNATKLLRLLFDGSDISSVLSETSGNFAEPDELERVAESVISLHPDAAGKYRKGNAQVINYLVGLCMQELSGKARANEILEVLRRRLA